MSKPIIEVENLSKQYRIGAREEPYGTLRESLTGAFKAPMRRLRRGSAPNENDNIWALKDINFEVQPGEVSGIIGRNGAGKSTLLKILSRITEPTTGSIKLYGRVASLLEVGTGFHPELTGRENIFLNGAILGMGKREIESKFDEMVEFAEVAKFIDTPVKRYSSGMYLRLAFAVAAHLDPEILIVDEVLAVGDSVFQNKCLGRMNDVAKQGRTVLLVSHNMGAVKGLCKHAYWMEHGRLKASGEAGEIVSRYLSDASVVASNVAIEQMPRLAGGRDLRLIGLDLLNEKGEPAETFSFDDAMTLRFHVKVLNQNRRHFAVECTICSLEGEPLIYFSSSPQGKLLIVPTDEIVTFECRIPRLALTAGKYYVRPLLSIPFRERIDEVERAVSFEITDCDIYGTGFNVENTRARTSTATEWTILDGAKPLQ